MYQKKNYLQNIKKVNDVNEIGNYQEGTLILSDNQLILDYCKCQNIPVAAFEHDDIKNLRCENILLDVDDVDDYVFEDIYRRCKGLPLEIADTERLAIREFALNDLDDLFKLYSNPQLTEFIEPLYDYEKEKEYEKNYIEFVYKMYGFGMWLIFEKQTGRLIGRAGIEMRDTCNRKNQAEMGFCISPDKWHKGYGYEVCSKIIELAREEYNLESLIARCSRKNIKSQNLLKKLGFERTDEVVGNEDIYCLFL